ncbi:hypothetical protein LTR28_004278, partial [Elasticomyces elasticus]
MNLPANPHHAVPTEYAHYDSYAAERGSGIRHMFTRDAWEDPEAHHGQEHEHYEVEEHHPLVVREAKQILQDSGYLVHHPHEGYPEEGFPATKWLGHLHAREAATEMPWEHYYTEYTHSPTSTPTGWHHDPTASHDAHDHYHHPIHARDASHDFAEHWSDYANEYSSTTWQGHTEPTAHPTSWPTSHPTKFLHPAHLHAREAEANADAAAMPEAEAMYSYWSAQVHSKPTHKASASGISSWFAKATEWVKPSEGREHKHHARDAEAEPQPGWND